MLLFFYLVYVNLICYMVEGANRMINALELGDDDDFDLGGGMNKQQEDDLLVNIANLEKQYSKFPYPERGKEQWHGIGSQDLVVIAAGLYDGNFNFWLDGHIRILDAGMYMYIYIIKPLNENACT